jgi:uncharacterized protein (TIGR03790 family)
VYKYLVVFLSVILGCSPVFALEPNEILIIANSDCNQSVALAKYYCEKRNVPADNILALPLGTGLSDTISRDDYDKQIAGPVRNKLSGAEFAGKIRCLLTTYGVPIKVGKRGALKNESDKLAQLKSSFEREQGRLAMLNLNNLAASAEQKKNVEKNIAYLKSEIDRINGEETGASVDSELAMILFGSYELYRWQPNKLKYKMPYWDYKSLMICRLDGPGFKIAQGLIDKAMSAERTGLHGAAYIDSRGLAEDKTPSSFGCYDQSLRDLVVLLMLRTDFTVTQERTEKLFEPHSCPRTVIYCGWYSLQKYIDAFDFVDGAIGYHISSLEAIDLRDPNSSQWCPAMLRKGITATLGAVAEPYLHSFPEPREFFLELLDGCCLVEAYYHTQPFNSWQLVLIGDPLYTPFKKRQSSLP